MAHIEAPYYMEYRSLVTSSAAGSTDTVSNRVNYWKWFRSRSWG